MANNKIGLIYYKIDTDRYQDIKIKRLKRKHGGLGLAVYDFLLCEIYREKGCYLEWDEYVLFDISEYFGIKEELLIEIIEQAIVIELFDKGMFYKHNVLTSQSIQTRYSKICKDAKRKEIVIPEEINLLKVPEESPKVPEESPKLPKVSKKVQSFDLSEFDLNYQPIIQEWLDYKRSRKETYKSDRSVKVLYSKLYEMSGGVPYNAKKIIEQSIASNWAGIFELKDEKNKRNTQGEQRKRIILAEAAEISNRRN